MTADKPMRLDHEIGEHIANIASARAERERIAPDKRDDRSMLVTQRAKLVESAPWGSYPHVGSRFPEFVLSDIGGVEHSLGKLLAEGSLVVVFYRGGWCPYCNITLRAYQRAIVPSLAKLHSSMVAISPQLPESSRATAEARALDLDPLGKGAEFVPTDTAGLDFPLLSDIGNDLARKLNLAYEVSAEYMDHLDGTGRDLRKINGMDDDHLELVTPATFVIDEDATIRFADIHPDFTSRTEPADILDALRATADA
jgi:peroxiredoxin